MAGAVLLTVALGHPRWGAGAGGSVLAAAGLLFGQRGGVADFFFAQHGNHLQGFVLTAQQVFQVFYQCGPEALLAAAGQPGGRGIAGPPFLASGHGGQHAHFAVGVALDRHIVQGVGGHVRQVGQHAVAVALT